MNQDRHVNLRGAPQATHFARAGFDRPVEHLHFDRVARVWRRHADHQAAVVRPPVPVLNSADGVCA